MLIKKYKIYSLSSSENPLYIKYIGCTMRENINLRLRQHINTAKTESTYKANWINKVIKNGFTIIMNLIEDNIDKQLIDDKEKFYIKQYRKKAIEQGFILTNIEDGGIKNKNITYSSRLKMRLAKLGKKCSEETKKKMSQAAIGKPKSIQMRQKLSLIKKGQIVSEATREKLRIKHTGKKHSEETKRKVSENSAKFWLGKNLYEETKLKISKAHKGKLRPERNKKIVQYDLKGNLIKIWESAKIAALNLNLCRANIVACLKGRRNHVAGFIWCYDGFNPNIDFEFQEKHKPCKSVCQFTLDNKFISEYQSISEAGKAININKICIGNVCRGTQKSAGGFKWRYAA